MDNEHLKELFRKINVWKRGDQRAPHKPLLTLYALSRLSTGQKNSRIPYQEVDEALRPLLAQFGPTRKSYHPEQPFWWLQTDGIWELDIDPATLPRRKSGNNPTKSQLLRHNVHGGFPQNILQTLQGNRSLISEIAYEILEKHFPESMHDEILSIIGLDLSKTIVNRTVRDPAFRETVLRAYEYRCAVCGLDIRIGNQTLGLEAAHVKWHQAGGPSTVDNGIALCILHHKIFDYGAFTISQNDRQLIVSEKAHGTNGFNETLMQHHGKPVRTPVNPAYSIKDSYIRWHEREVFKKPARYFPDGDCQ